MNLHDALEKAARILEEEHAQPTLTYLYTADTWPSKYWAKQFDPKYKGWMPSVAVMSFLLEERQKRPRYVYEDPTLFAFVSTNFDLLVKIISQISEGDRESFISSLLHHVRKPLGKQPVKGSALLVEFCIRTGHLKELVAATSEPEFPTISLANMTRQIEEMIALNFNLFSDSDLVSLSSGLAHLYDIARRQTYSAIGSRGGPMKKNPHYVAGFSEAGKEIAAAIEGIREECRKARYFYLKGALQELPNLEIESDKLKVEGFLLKLGFNATMVQSLNAAESDYKSTATAFELKNCLGHLRSFLEHLHRKSAKAIANAAKEAVADKWGDATLFLRQQGYFTKQQEAFSASLYTLLSDESVHPLTTDREYARLLRNVVIEYGVMFLTVLDKRGVKI